MALTLDRSLADPATITPLAGHLGAEVVGLDLGGELSEPLIDAIHGLVAEYSMVAFRDQEFDLDHHDALTRALGGHGETPFLESIDGRPGLVRVVKEADEATSFNFGGAWHSDWSFQPQPPAYTLLHAHDIPTHGGDTIWSSQTMAYESLSDGLKATLADMNAVHSAGWSYAADGVLARTAKGRTMQINTTDDALAEHVHPVLIRTERSGRTSLFLNATYAVRFEGWTVEESQPLLRYLNEHAVREHFTCRLRWQKNTLAIWDNRATQHLALNDYTGQRRELCRSTVRGTTPTRA